ncbi:hypothetical protein [uncultured Lacinutrix sp.]|uniref:hypothetical protein n=1 Tax=uncultured Lacinutrix sp. TaxID=574032 RepID=UPI0026165F34|nr:hypothetical protein [uncultured Lacinutrix sp.]
MKLYNSNILKGLCIAISLFAFSCNLDSKELFHDDFESKDLKKDWKTSGNGIISIDTTKAFSGKQSIKFVSGEGYKNHAFINLKSLFPLAENRFRGSLKMYIENASPDGIHWTMIQASGKVKGEDYSAEVRYGGQHQKQLMANYDTKGVKSDCWQHSDVKIPEGEWFTINFLFDTNTNEMQCAINGKKIDKLAVTNQGEGCVENDLNNLWVFPIFDTLSFGWADYQTGGGQRTLWIDDIIITP